MTSAWIDGRRCCGGIATLVGAIAFLALAQPAAAEPFRVYDGLNNGGKPSLAALGFAAIDVGYRRAFFAGEEADEPDEATVRETARKVVDEGSGLLVIDIEHWPMDIRTRSPREVLATIEKFRRIVGWLRDERPSIKLGMYGGVPLRDYWAPVRYERDQAQGEHFQQLAAWHKANDFLAELAALFDFLFPSFYTFYEDRDGWATEVRHALEEARQYGKPVLPFVLARYHPSAQPRDLGFAPLPVDYWTWQLETLHAACVDGLVVWGAYRHDWSEEQELPWVAATQAFIDAHPTKPAHCAS